MDHCKFHIHRRIWKVDEIDREEDVPYAVETLLGWTVLGVPLNDSNVNSIQSLNTDKRLMSLNDEKALKMIDESFDLATMSVAVPFKENSHLFK